MTENSTSFPLPQWAVDQQRRERRESLRAAQRFENACRSGDFDAVLDATDCLGNSPDDWRLAMRRAAGLGSVHPDVKAAFLIAWVTHKHIPLSVGHRPTIAKALRVLLPRTPVSSPTTIYRGCMDRERRRRTYGFSWTTSIDVAKAFAGAAGDGGVVLQAVANPEAVLVVRDMRDDEINFGNSPYDENEIIIDPFQIGSVTALPMGRK